MTHDELWAICLKRNPRLDDDAPALTYHGAKKLSSLSYEEGYKQGYKDGLAENRRVEPDMPAFLKTFGL